MARSSARIHDRLSPTLVLICPPISGSTIINQRFFFVAVCVLLSTGAAPHADVLEEELTAPRAPDSVAPATSCADSSQETPLRQQIASAGIMHNLAEHPKSIRAVAAKLLTDALDSPHPPAACAVGCKPAKTPAVIYRVAPVAFLPAAKQQALCLSLEKDTQSHPLLFSPAEFKTVEKLNAWVMEFSQGRGDQGKKMYEQCGGNCSPRYTFLIAQGANGLKVDASVVCGLARDKSSDDYTVSTAVRDRCEVDTTPLASALDTP